MVIAGIGAGISELTALAATSEMAPTAKRGKYVAILVFTILPFCPSVLWHTTQVKSFPHPLGNQTLTVFNRLEMVRTALWCMDCHRFFHDAILLLPTTTSEFRWTKQQGNFGTN